MYKLKTLNLEITKECNLNCKHCGIECGTNKDIKNELNANEINKLLDDVTHMGCKFLIIAGGEPFLSTNIWEVLNKASLNNLRVSILTNGLLLKEDVCKKLSSYNNIEFIRISLEFPYNNVMENFRGAPDIVTNVITNLQLLKKYKINSGIGMTILPDNIVYIEDVAKIAYENGAKFFRAIPVVPTGMAKNLNIDEQFYIKSLKEVIQLSQYYPRPNNNYISRDIVEDMITTCPSSYSAVSISSDGYIGLCPMIEAEKKIGNIKNTPFNELYNSLLNVRENYNCDISENCKQCTIYSICRGGCLVEKISRYPNTNQEICIKSIINKTKNTFQQQDLFHEHINFSSMLCASMKANNINICFRALPIWTIFF
jgi:radical SAM protein with 4Fe4S-binding SPASM domain